MNYSDIKKLDEDSLQVLTEGPGPADSCICHLLSPPTASKKGIRSSIRKAIATLSTGKRRRSAVGGTSFDIPLSFTHGGKGGIQSTREVVKRKASCGKCGCDNENIVLKHSFANIRITSPDVSSICPCSQDCLPDKEKLMNNIKVTVERVELDIDAVDSEFNIYENNQPYNPFEPKFKRDHKSINSLVDAQYEDDVSEWSGGDEL